MTRLYPYVGSRNILERTQGHPPGAPIRSAADLTRYVAAAGQDELTVTYTVDGEGLLRVADRHSEHVACAGNTPVRAAGEMTIELLAEVSEVLFITNQSTGYCPEPACWDSVAKALDAAAVEHPQAFTTAFEFRRCERCSAINIVKDGWLYCPCGAQLTSHWNFGSTT